MDHSLVQCGEGKRREGEQVLAGVSELVGHVGELGPQGGDDLAELGPDVAAVGLGEDRADGGRDHLGLGPRDTGQSVSQEVDPAALPRRPDEHLGDGRFEPQVVIGDHELHVPRALGRAGPSRNAVQKAPSSESPTSMPSTSRSPGGRHPGDHHHGPGDDAALHPPLHVGGVAEQIGEARRGRGGRVRKDSRSLSSSVQMRLTSDFDIPEAAPRAWTRSSTLRVDTPWT